MAGVQDQNSGSSHGTSREKPLYTRFQEEKQKASANKKKLLRCVDSITKCFKSTGNPSGNEEQRTNQATSKNTGLDEGHETPVDKSKVYGCENEELWLVRRLIKPEKEGFKAIGIVGMPEIGKTTLSQLVFDNEYVKQHFFPRIWVSTFKIERPNKQKVVETMLRELDVDMQMITGSDNPGIEALLYALHLKLIGKRYLIVLDGVRKEDDYCQNLISPDSSNDGQGDDEFSFEFPKGSGGAVIVTSRNKDAAKTMVGKEENLHFPQPISDLDSCIKIYNSLLKNEVTPLTDDFKKEFEKKAGRLAVAARLMAEIKNEKDQNAQSTAPPPANDDSTNELGNQNAPALVPPPPPPPPPAKNDSTNEPGDQNARAPVPPPPPPPEPAANDDSTNELGNQNARAPPSPPPPPPPPANNDSTNEPGDQNARALAPPPANNDRTNEQDDQNGAENNDRTTPEPEQKEDDDTTGDAN